MAGTAEARHLMSHGSDGGGGDDEDDDVTW